MSARPGAPRVLHIFGSLAAEDPQARRAVRLANGLGGRLRHSFFADDGDFGALTAVEKGVPHERLESFPTISGMPTPGRLQAVARAMIDYHLVLSYGRAGSRAALAHTTFSEVHSLPPVIHHEDGSDETDKGRKGLASRWARRVGLGKSAGLVVPSETMEAVALVDWQQPIGRVKVIRDGVDLDALGKKARPNALPRLQKRAGERWIVCLAGPGAGESLATAVRTLARLDESWHLVAAVDGEQRARALAEAGRSEVEDRFHALAPTTSRSVLLGLADLFLLPDSREPVPFAALEAMGAGLPVVGPATGDLAGEIGGDNADYLSAPGGSAALADAFARLTGDDYLRKAIGAANRERAVARRGQAAMIASYRRLYASAMGRDEI